MGDFNPFRSIPLNSYDLAVQRKRQEDLARSSRIAAERSANTSPAKPKVFSKEQADQVFAAYGKRFGVVDTGLSPQEIQNLQDMGESPENIQRLVEQDRQRAVTFALAHMSDPTAGQVVKETATPAGLAGALNSAALGLPEAIVTATSSPEQRRALEEWKKQNPGYGYGGVVGDIASMAIPTGAILKMGGYAAKAFNAKEVATSLFNAAKYASGAPSAGSFMVAAAEQAVPRGVATALQTGNAGQGLDVVSVGTLAALPFGKALQQISKTSPKLAEDLTKYLEEQSARKLSDASIASTAKKPAGLLAPNGKPSNLTLEQYQMVRTPKFKKMFGDWENDPANATKALDANGEPLVLYHGGEGGIGEFDTSRGVGGIAGNGTYLTTNHAEAKAYSEGRIDLKEKSKDPEVYPVFLNTRNLGDLRGDSYNTPVLAQNYLENLDSDGLAKALRDNHDLVTYGPDLSPSPILGDHYVAFSPNQIKSATKNSGEFNPENPNIYDAPATKSGLASTAVKPEPAPVKPDNPVPEETPELPYGGYKFKEDKKTGGLVLQGDSEEIQSMLPDSLKGSAGNGQVVFSSTAAPRVKAILEGADNAYSRAGKVTQNIRYKSGARAGQYIGAPEIGNTPGKITGLRNMVKKLALEGERGRYWYEHSGQAFLDMTGGDVEEAKKLAATMAIYSPQAKVDANSTFGAKAWAQNKAGDPIKVKTGFQNNAAENVLSKGLPWGGEKTNNFYRNLLRVIDPQGMGAADKQGQTVDMWMMRAFGYDSDSPTAAQYRFVENESNKMAKELGWEPQQFQAAVWVAMKARMENESVVKSVQDLSEKNGWLRWDKSSKGKDVRVILNEDAHRQNWIDQAMAHVVTPDDTAGAKFDFADGLERNFGQMSWEGRPGVTTGILPGIHSAPYHQQVQFQKAVENALLDDNGNDILAQKLGILRGPDTRAPGVWKGDVAASTQSNMVMAPKSPDEGKKAMFIDPSQRKLLDTYAAIKGLLLRQEGVGYHRPFYSNNKGDNNALELHIGRPLTSTEAKNLYKSVDANAKAAGLPDEWNKSIGLVSSPNGMRLINFGAGAYREALYNATQEGVAKGLDGKEIKAFAEDVAAKATKDWAHLTDTKKTIKLFKDAVEDWQKTTPANLKSNTIDFHSDGNLIENDWGANPNGDEYTSRISGAGSSDILRWATDVLGPRLQQVYEDASKQYGWGDAGTIPGLKPNWRESSKPTGNVKPAKEELLIKAKPNLTTNDRMTELLSRSARIPTMLESNDRKNRRQAQ